MNQDEKSARLLNEDTTGESFPSAEVVVEQAYLVGRGEWNLSKFIAVRVN